ncbi:MAG: 23S rRNA (pseudouridine(1915)-N(3))-methyltransferase RlmH [Desulfarculaceae bacterium]|jgi:23S rRNA (pseudouridine1915-N3)-methyltransferase
MTHLLLMVGKPKAAYIAQGLSDYAGRLKAYGGCSLDPVRPERTAKSRPEAEILKAEGERLLQRLGSGDAVWALDRQGVPWTSEEWARNLERTRLEGRKRLVLMIGGHLGLWPGAIKRAQQQVSLGPHTLPHELASLVALEQLYRAHTILAGTPYHRP